MGVTMASEKIFSAFVGEDPKLTLWHGHSFTGNPLGCAAANASLDLLEESPEKYQEFESRHLPFLKELEQHPLVKNIRVCGTIAAFDIKVKDTAGYLNNAGRSLKASALKDGVFLRPLGNVVYLLPPLCINDSQLKQCYIAIKRGLDTL